jgi:tetratricopeptide (TPR) repeat protein
VIVAIAIALIAVAYDPDTTASSPKRIVALLVALALSALTLPRTPRKVRLGSAQGAFFVALALSALSWVRGPPHGVLDLSNWIAAAGLGFAIAATGPAQARRIARGAAIAVGAVVGTIATAQALGGARGIAIDGLQGNGNWLGLLLAITLPLSFDRTTSKVAWAAIALQATALGLSHGRVGWIAAGIALTVLVVRAPRRCPAFALAALLAFLGAVSVTGAFGKTRAASAKSTAASEVPIERAAEGRLTIARIAAHAAIDAAPLGVGLGRFPDAFRDAQARALANVTPKIAARSAIEATTAHDEPLQIATESGPLAALAFVTGLALAIFAARRWPAGASALIALAVCCAADEPLRRPAVVALVAAILAALPGRVRLDGGAVRLVHAAGLVLVAATLLPAVRAHRAERLVTRADLDPGARRALLERAARIDRGSAAAAFRLGLARFDDRDLEGARAALLAARLLDDDASTSLALANVAVARGDLDAAEEDLRHALRRRPGSFRALIGLGEVLRRRGRLAEASEALAAARGIRPHDVTAIDLEERIAEDRADR